MRKAFETERMYLRELQMEDLDSLMGIFSDPEAMRYYPATKTRDEAENWIRWNIRSYEEYGFGLWACVLKETEEFVGQFGITCQEVEGTVEPEVGWLFLRLFWKRGLASEAARGCVGYGFEQLGLDRIISLPDPENMPSRRVAERAGMTLERETWMDRWSKSSCIYSIERSG